MKISFPETMPKFRVRRHCLSETTSFTEITSFIIEWRQDFLSLYNFVLMGYPTNNFRETISGLVEFYTSSQNSYIGANCKECFRSPFNHGFLNRKLSDGTNSKVQARKRPRKARLNLVDLFESWSILITFCLNLLHFSDILLNFIVQFIIIQTSIYLDIENRK